MPHDRGPDHVERLGFWARLQTDTVVEERHHAYQVERLGLWGRLRTGARYRVRCYLCTHVAGTCVTVEEAWQLDHAANARRQPCTGRRWWQ